ncbi:TetR family transcriptional regulator [Spirillospora sp. NPDC029432]|uniref:TetR/AcrR family transcriptional regulator n=1 Tax=Spirillospora sp. NPDC029432 TaxID=3154599 RepID=UPI0034536AC9
MPPSPNLQRRRALADAAVEVLGTSGIHGLSHRAVDVQAGLPPGTTSNYFRNRDALLEAAARRAMELHQADMVATQGPEGAVADQERMVELIAASLYRAATEHRVRYLAIYELTMESTRRPALRRALAGIAGGAHDFTVEHHRDLDLATTREQVGMLITLYGGALFTLVTAPERELTPESVRPIARAVVVGGTAGARA